MNDRVGQQLGNYRLLRLLGQGGQASVYLGEHVYLKSQAAIKVRHSVLAEREQTVFLQEAQTLVRLSHPHIVRVLDFALHDGIPFLVMEYAPHGTLRQRHPRGTRVSLDVILPYVKQVAVALQYTHNQGLIHRDVKPENMLLNSHDQVLLSDFGLVMIAPRLISSELTEPMEQSLAGTMSYLAPEEVRGRAHISSDQYALAVVVYEWLCGKPPFQGPFLEMAVKLVSLPPPLLREQIPNISPEIEQVVLRALAKEPEQRFSSVEEFATALERAYQEGVSPLLTPVITLEHRAERPIEREAFLSLSVRREDESYDTLPSMISPHLVGRANQLASLHLLVEQAKRGDGHMALIGGEAGIGKSRLVSEVKSYAATQGYLLLQGNCFPNDIHYPYAPLLDLLRFLYTSQQDGINVSPPTNIASTPTGKTPSRQEKLEQLARDIFPLLPEFVPDQTTPRVSLEPEQEKHRIFAVLANFFTYLSASSPIFLIIEDVHWSDSTSLDFLHYLARRTKSHPIFLMLTYRHDEARSELSSWLTHLKRERIAQEIKLGHLSRNEVDLMLSALFDPQQTSFDMRRFLHGELLDTLYTLTEGNPFFVEETISAMIAAGNIFYAEGYWNRRSQPAAPIPKSVQDAVQQRTQQMGEAAKRVLTLAAVAGRQFDFVLLQQITQYNEQQLIHILKELVSAQLVVEESAEQFAFRHALTRQAIYSRLLARESSLLHRTIAETMERYSSNAPDTPLEDLAYHFYQGRVWQKAYDYAQQAGEKALRLYSHRAAIDYFSLALDAAHHLSLPPVPSLYRARGQAYETLGEFEQAQQDYTNVLDAAHKMNDRVAEWQSAIDLGFRWVGSDYTKAETWFRHALTLAESLDDPVLHARSLNRIGNWHLNVEQPHEAFRYHQEALTIFQGLDDKRGIAETLDLLGMASYLGGDLIQGTAYYQQAIPLFHELGDKPGLTSSLATFTMRGPTFHTDSLLAAASLTEVLPDAEQALKIAREIGHRSAEAYALFQLGTCLGSQGEYSRALAACQQSLHIAEEIEHRQWQTAANAMLGGVYSGLLALQQAHEHFEQALALAHEIGSSFWIRMCTGYLASASIVLRDYVRAETLLHAALNTDTPAQTLGQWMLWCASVELALAQGHPTQALEIIDRLIASAKAGDKGQSSLRIMKLRGEALVMLQRLAEAEDAFNAVREIARTQGVRPVHWRISILLGNLYQSQGRKTEAEQAFAAARTLIQELAATITDDVLRDNFLQQAMAMLPHTPPLSAKHMAKSSFGGLTEREREVARLIAEGKSNQEIAVSLVVSKRTIETHVGNIMFKLDCTSRTQIAVWAVDVGLVKKAEIEPST